MHDDYRTRPNQAFDYSPPTGRSSSASGPLMLVGGIIALFILAMLFLGGGSGQTTAPADTPPAAVDTTPIAPTTGN